MVGVMPSGALAKATKASAEDTVAAWNSLVDAIEKLDKGEVGPLVDSQDWNSILALMDEPEFAKIEDNLLKLVNGPILNADDKKVRMRAHVCSRAFVHVLALTSFRVLQLFGHFRNC